MAMNSDRKAASAGMAGSFLGLFAFVLVVSGLTLGLGPRGGDVILIDASTGDQR
jgi:hypothetical protein